MLLNRVSVSSKQRPTLAEKYIRFYQQEHLFEPNESFVYVWNHYFYSLCDVVSTLSYPTKVLSNPLHATKLVYLTLYTTKLVYQKLYTTNCSNNSSYHQPDIIDMLQLYWTTFHNFSIPNSTRRPTHRAFKTRSCPRMHLWKVHV